MSTASIQSQLDTVFSQQETNQFGTQRYELMFKPGSYSGLNANIGFYTSIAGLVATPTTSSSTAATSLWNAGWFGGAPPRTFWRSTENFSVTPPAGTAYERWAVAQAAPMAGWTSTPTSA